MHPYFEHLEDIFRAGVRKADPYDLVCGAVSLKGPAFRIKTESSEQVYDLDKIERIVVLGAGKATARMALALELILGDRISTGFVVVKQGHTEPLTHIRWLEAGHPIPDDRGVQGTREMLSIAEKADEKALVITLISGGGSALMPCPGRQKSTHREADLTLADKQEVTRHLLECGATIHETNCIRKHLSGIKGGQLTQAIHPARSVSLILSDVVGDNLDVIASGPTVPDPTDWNDVQAIIDKYSLNPKLPEAIRARVRLGLDGVLPDTPKPEDPVFKNSANILIGTNYLSLQAAAARADELGFRSIILSSQITGEAREVARVLYAIGKDALKHDLLGSGNLCIITGGETTVTIRGKGKGGRNQELALAFLAEMESSPVDADGIFFLSAATDGNDGPTDAAGAFASKEMLGLAVAAGCDINTSLAENNAYVFFDSLGHLLKTGPTNTNVCDLQVMLVIRPS